MTFSKIKEIEREEGKVIMKDGIDRILEEEDETVKRHILLERCSLLVMQGEGRYSWQHGISDRRSDNILGKGILNRERRVSITFRYIQNFFFLFHLSN